MEQNPYYTRNWVLKRYAQGPLFPHLNSFANFLEQYGYRYGTGQRYVREVGRLSLWLDQQGIKTEAFSEQVIETYLGFRMQGLHSEVKKGPYKRLLEYMYQADAIKAYKGLQSFLDQRIHQYWNHLTQNRGLKPETIRRYVRVVKNFLSYRFGNGQITFSDLRPVDIEKYLLERSKRCTSLSLNGEASALRSFLRFLHLQGEISNHLLQCVPSAAYRPQREVPVFLNSTQISILLKQCNEKTPKGMRDKAILLLLIRLGLRAIEVYRLTFEDIEWQAGYITVRGKSLKSDRMPLLYDVGEAISTYLRYGRPKCSTRHLFVRSLAPFKPFSSSSAISNVVRQALNRAGLNPPRKGAHLLRYSFATQMLRQGACLAEIGHILRHKQDITTAVYARIDFKQLRPLARSWPEGDIL